MFRGVFMVGSSFNLTVNEKREVQKYIKNFQKLLPQNVPLPAKILPTLKMICELTKVPIVETLDGVLSNIETIFMSNRSHPNILVHQAFLKDLMGHCQLAIYTITKINADLGIENFEKHIAMIEIVRLSCLFEYILIEKDSDKKTITFDEVLDAYSNIVIPLCKNEKIIPGYEPLKSVIEKLMDATIEARTLTDDSDLKIKSDLIAAFSRLTLINTSEATSSSSSSSTLVFSHTPDRAKEFRKFADQGNLDKLKEMFHSDYLNSQGTDTGHTALHRAAGKGHLNVVEWLIKMGADVSIKDPKKQLTPRQLATHQNKHIIAEFLKNEEGKQFRRAADENDCEALERLFSEDILNLQGPRTQHTALHRAALQGHAEAVSWLLQHNANMLILDANNFVAVQLAMQRREREVVRIFERKMREILVSRIPKVTKVPSPA